MSGQPNLAITGFMLLKFMTTHSFQLHFADTVSESHGSRCRSDHWCRVWGPGQACLDDDSCISYDFVVGSQADSCRFCSEATLPENRAAQT